MFSLLCPVFSHLSGGFVDLLGSLFVSAGGLGGLGFMIGAMLPPVEVRAALIARRAWKLLDWELVVIAAVTTLPLYYVDGRLFVGSVILTTVVYKFVTSVLRRYVRRYIRRCIRFYMRQFANNSRLVRRILDDGDGEDELLDGEEEDGEGDGDVAWLALMAPNNTEESSDSPPRRVRTRSSLTLPHNANDPSFEPVGRILLL